MFTLPTFPGRSLLTLVLVLAPACVVWWTGRALARNADDPLIAERLFASRVRARYALAVAWVMLVAFATDHAWWAVPVMVAVRALAAYPLRRVLQGETWSPDRILLVLLPFHRGVPGILAAADRRSGSRCAGG